MICNLFAGRKIRISFVINPGSQLEKGGNVRRADIVFPQ